MKHFNAAHIWGVVRDLKKLKSKNGKPYLELQVDCPSARYGPVRAFCRMWQVEKVDEFVRLCKPTNEVKLSGVLSQYNGRDGNVKTNFTIFSAEPWNPEQSRHRHKRAVFILLGEIIDVADEEQETVLTVRLKREGVDEERFCLYLSDETLISYGRPEVGRIYRLKGAMVQEEDQWGETRGPLKPVVEELQEMSNEE